ncbi:hypothetical protein [Pseudomonas aeruginosa]|uniref:hypothetical protein n=1 Tax=Pseudomonas aeruginosa TaxID=287 RepID=UPI003EDF7119
MQPAAQLGANTRDENIQAFLTDGGQKIIEALAKSVGYSQVTVIASLHRAIHFGTDQ